MIDESKNPPNKCYYVWHIQESTRMLCAGWFTIINGQIYLDSFETADLNSFDIASDTGRSFLRVQIEKIVTICQDQYLRTLQHLIANYDDIGKGSFVESDIVDYYKKHRVYNYCDESYKLLRSILSHPEFPFVKKELQQ